MTLVSDMPIQDAPFDMFGGAKNNGLVRFNGDWIVNELTREPSISCLEEVPVYSASWRRRVRRDFDVVCSASLICSSNSAWRALRRSRN